MISTNVRDKFPSSHLVLLDNLDRILVALSKNSLPIYSFNPHQKPITFYNSYIDFALSVYVDKFKQLYESLAQSLEQQWYMVYAQSARAIIENAATLHHYVQKKEFEKLKNNYQSEVGSASLIKDAIYILDSFIRGTRFSWDAFISGNFEDINKDTWQDQPSQINSKTCVEHWCKESPNLESLYKLLCDLVHPNLGSNFLVMRSIDGNLVAGGKDGSSIVMFIVCPTLAGIIGVYKTIQEDILRLESYKIPVVSSS